MGNWPWQSYIIIVILVLAGIGLILSQIDIVNPLWGTQTAWDWFIDTVWDGVLSLIF